MVACKVQDLQSLHPVNLPDTPQAEPHPFGTSFCSPGADGASAFAFSGSGINDRLPDVSRTAFPPDALMAAYREHFRHQIAVARRIPLGGKLWVARCQVIKTGQNAPARAIGTAGVFYGSGCNDRLPRMSAGTPPPGLSITVGRHTIRGQIAVAFCIPFCGNVREERQQVVIAGNSNFAVANRAAAAPRPVLDARPP